MTLLSCAFRKHLPRQDLEFIISHLSTSAGEADALLALLTDPGSVDRILDRPDLFETVLESTEQLRLSPRLYFYILARHTLKEAGIDDADLADYVAGVLDEFGTGSRRPPGGAPSPYLIDWMQRIEASAPEERFGLYVRAGNHLLFLTGVFPEYIAERRRRRGAPDLGWYEDFGRHSFQSAARHPMSRAAECERLFVGLADCFSDLRKALNELASRLVTMEREPAILTQPEKLN